MVYIIRSFDENLHLYLDLDKAIKWDGPLVVAV